jgi:regulator of protease activity HflC (stomatin/prohibitin superfamily)
MIAFLGSMLTLAVLVVAVVLITGIRIAAEYERSVVFRLGRYVGIRGPGLYWLIPLGIETQRKLDMRTVTVDVERQETITKDSVTVKVNAVLWFKIFDPTKAVIEVRDYYAATYQIALTTLRSIIGQHMLDEVLKEREDINKQLREIVDVATDPWGIKVEMVEIKEVEIPPGMQRAMAREAEAAREKRARIIKAEAEFESAQKLADASNLIALHPSALELRRMQMVSEVGSEQNSTTVIMLPSDFVYAAQSLTDFFQNKADDAEAAKRVR